MILRLPEEERVRRRTFNFTVILNQTQNEVFLCIKKNLMKFSSKYFDSRIIDGSSRPVVWEDEDSRISTVLWEV